MAAKKCRFVDAAGKACHIWVRGGSQFCVHHTEGAVGRMTDDEKLALLEHEMRCTRHRNALGVDRAKLLLALMTAHDRIARGPAAPEVLDQYGVEDDTPGAKARRKLMAAAK